MKKYIITSLIVALAQLCFAQSPTASPRPYPVSINHIGITVPDLNKAMDFYTRVMGWYHISGPVRVVEADTKNPLTSVSIGIYGKGWKEFRFAHFSTSNGVGVEMFEFKNNKDKRSSNSPFRTGIYHFAVQDPDVEGLVKRILANGGRQVSPITELAPGVKPYKMVYMTDPFGNFIEIYSNSYELQTEGLK
ncbi:VOC family protein [Pedobacter montanisoli]|uniref:VOC family protein n=1 Tax=Pedobacter montanisoli TaxID=2923277 RepID=A0ABS9ZSA3_9SPHI|nr:VOC family protein [Pedobacter montanisoli]MCJ0741378.1 VOC family protein [Pedobacter montanisoli]